MLNGLLAFGFALLLLPPAIPDPNSGSGQGQPQLNPPVASQQSGSGQTSSAPVHPVR